MPAASTPPSRPARALSALHGGLGSSRGALAGGALVLLVVVVLTVVLLTRGEDRPTPAAPAPTSPSSTTSAPPGVDTTEDATYAPARPGYPDRLVVPALDVDAPIRPIKAPDRTLVPPADPQVLGWWADGARPGAETGSALVVGHTVHTGGGALDDLETLEQGDEILVHSHRGAGGEGPARTEGYVVRDVEVYRKGTLARRAADLFSQEVDGRLVLLTCEDWDGTRYLSNVVVTAVPAADEDDSGGTARG